jgi:hypothetical protein
MAVNGQNVWPAWGVFQLSAHVEVWQETAPHAIAVTREAPE